MQESQQIHKVPNINHVNMIPIHDPLDKMLPKITPSTKISLLIFNSNLQDF